MINKIPKPTDFRTRPGILIAAALIALAATAATVAAAHAQQQQDHCHRIVTLSPADDHSGFIVDLSFTIDSQITPRCSESIPGDRTEIALEDQISPHLDIFIPDHASIIDPPDNLTATIHGPSSLIAFRQAASITATAEGSSRIRILDILPEFAPGSVSIEFDPHVVIKPRNNYPDFAIDLGGVTLTVPIAFDPPQVAIPDSLHQIRSPAQELSFTVSAFPPTSEVTVFTQHDSSFDSDLSCPTQLPQPHPPHAVLPTDEAGGAEGQLHLDPELVTLTGDWRLCAFASPTPGEYVADPDTRFRVIRAIAPLDSWSVTAPGDTLPMRVLPPFDPPQTFVDLQFDHNPVDHDLTNQQIGSDFDFTVPTDSSDGEHTLILTTTPSSPNPVLTTRVHIGPLPTDESPPTPPTGDPPPLQLHVSPLPTGDPPGYPLLSTIQITGTGFSPGLSTTIYALHPIDPADSTNTQCEPYHEGLPARTAPADTEGFTSADFTLDLDSFPNVGHWRFCAHDGAGLQTDQPLLVNLQRILLIEPEPKLLFDTDTTILIVPPLPADPPVSVTSVQLGRETDPIALLTPADEPVRASFVVRTQIDPGTYRLSVVFSDNSSLFIDVDVLPTPDPPTLSVTPTRVNPGEPLTAQIDGLLPEESFTIYAVPTADLNTYIADLEPQETPEDHPEPNQANDCQIAAELADAIAFTTAGVADLTGSATVHIETSTATATGDWSFCVQGAFSQTSLTPQIVTIDVLSPLRIRVTTPSTGDPPGHPMLSTIQVYGLGFSPGLSATVYALPPADPSTPASTDCEPLASDSPTSTTFAAPDGSITTQFILELETFPNVGQWRFCAHDGAGLHTDQPLLVNLQRILLIEPEPRLLFDTDTTILIVPPLPADPPVSITSVQLGRETDPIALLTPADEPVTASFVVRTQIDPGTYRLSVVFSDDSSLFIDVSVSPPPDPPTLSLSPTNVRAGQPLTAQADGLLPEDSFTIYAVPSDDLKAYIQELEAPADSPDHPDTSQPTPPSNGPDTQFPELTECQIAARLPGDTAFITEGKADPTGSATVTVETSTAPATGDWSFCLQGVLSQASETPETVTIDYGVIITNDGLIQQLEPAEITIVPVPPDDYTVGPLSLNDIHQPTQYSKGVLIWLNVPPEPGNHTAELFLGTEFVPIPITILSSVPPGYNLSPDDQCPETTRLVDTNRPGGSSTITYTFRIDPQSPRQIVCQEPNPWESDKLPSYVLPPESTTIMPDQEIRIDIHHDFILPQFLHQDISIGVESFDNRYGYSYRSEQTRVNHSQNPDDPHEIVIPPCSQWTTFQGEPAPCEIAHAINIEVRLDRPVLLPSDSTENYINVIRYQDSTIWDTSYVTTSLQVSPETITFNQSFNATGYGFPPSITTTIYGVNISNKETTTPPKPATKWSCPLIAAHGAELATAQNSAAGGFSASILADTQTFARPGDWLICAVDTLGAFNRLPTPLHIDYQVTLPPGVTYHAGDDSFVVVTPTPPEDLGPIRVTVGQQQVNFQMSGNLLRFILPVNLSGVALLTATFPDDIIGQIQLDSSTPILNVQHNEPDPGVRIGSLIRISTNLLSGERVCSPRLQRVEIAFLVDNQVPPENCVNIGANRLFSANVVIASPDLQVTDELALLYDASVGTTLPLTISTEDGATASAQLPLHIPKLFLTDQQGRSFPQEILQNQELWVNGSGFPRNTEIYHAPQVGFVSKPEGGRDTSATDGNWKLQYRIDPEDSVGKTIQFTPTIGGQKLDQLAIYLTVGIAAPKIEFLPNSLESGQQAVITASNLIRFTSGYSLAITHYDSPLFIKDPKTRRTARFASDTNGGFTATVTFPDFEALSYIDNAAKIDIQLYNPRNEPVPGAIITITHLLTTPEPTPPAPPWWPTRQPTLTPVPLKFGPPPTPTPRPPTPTPPPPPTIPIGPGPVDHREVTLTPASDGQSVAITWLPPLTGGRPSGYFISRSVAGAPNPEPLIAQPLGSLTNHHDRDVEPGQTYFYYISAHNQVGQGQRGIAAPASVTVPNNPSLVPKFRSAPPTVSIVSFTWETPQYRSQEYSPITKYTIERRIATETQWEMAATLDNRAAAWTDAGLKQDTPYQYRIAAHNHVGAGPPTPPLLVHTKAAALLAAPALEPTPQPTATPEPYVPITPGQPVTTTSTPTWLLIPLGILAAFVAVSVYVFLKRRRASAAAQSPQTTTPSWAQNPDDEDDEDDDEPLGDQPGDDPDGRQPDDQPPETTLVLPEPDLSSGRDNAPDHDPELYAHGVSNEPDRPDGEPVRFQAITSESMILTDVETTPVNPRSNPFSNLRQQREAIHRAAAAGDHAADSEASPSSPPDDTPVTPQPEQPVLPATPAEDPPTEDADQPESPQRRPGPFSALRQQYRSRRPAAPTPPPEPDSPPTEPDGHDKPGAPEDPSDTAPPAAPHESDTVPESASPPETVSDNVSDAAASAPPQPPHQPSKPDDPESQAAPHFSRPRPATEQQPADSPFSPSREPDGQSS